MDDGWIRAVRDGGPEAYRPFVQAYGSYIYRTVYAILQSPHDAEDVTQEVLLQIYRSLPDCRLEGWKTWITRIAVNKAIDWKRKMARRPELLTAEQSEPAQGTGAAAAKTNAQQDGASASCLHSASPSAESVALQRVRRKKVQERMQALPANYREVVTAYYVEDKSYEQIASETGLERKSVESRLYRARNWMKRHWRKEDFD